MPREDWDAHTLQRRYIGSTPPGERGIFSLRDVNEMQTLPFKGKEWEGEHLIVWGGSRHTSSAYNFSQYVTADITYVSTSSKGEVNCDAGMSSALETLCATTYQSSHSISMGGYAAGSAQDDIRKLAVASHTLNNSFGTFSWGNRAGAAAMSDGTYGFFFGGSDGSNLSHRGAWLSMASGGTTTNYGSLNNVGGSTGYGVQSMGTAQYPNKSYGITIGGHVQGGQRQDDEIRKINFNRSTSGSVSWATELSPDRASPCGLQGSIRFVALGGETEAGGWQLIANTSQMHFSNETLQQDWGDLSVNNGPKQSGASSRDKGYLVGGYNYSSSTGYALKEIRRYYPDRGTQTNEAAWSDFKDGGATAQYIINPGVSSAG